LTFYLYTNFVYSILFADAHTTRAFNWLRKTARGLIVGSWTATEFFALVHRRVRSNLLSENDAQFALADFDAFVSGKAQMLTLSSSTGALAVDLARDPHLKLSAADALHLAAAADGGHVLVSFDRRLTDAAQLRAYPFEIP
jgi:predicted nucleic acid-binding protein